MHCFAADALGVLCDVCELVSKQMFPAVAQRIILTASENNIIAQRIRPGVNGASGLGRRRAGVNTNTRKIVSEPRLKEIARLKVELLTARSYSTSYVTRRLRGARAGK